MRSGSVLALVLAACTSAHGVPDAGDDVGAGPGDLAADLCRPWARWFCERAEACGCGAELVGGVLDQDACVARRTRRCLATNPADLRIDRAGAQRCIERMRATIDCRNPDFGDCAVTAAPVRLGERCVLSGQCPVGAWCDPERFECVPDTALGAACADGSGACGTRASCRAGVCTSAPTLGDPCGAAFCEDGLVCPDGVCALADACFGACDGPTTCEVPLELGAPCPDDGCADDAECDGLRHVCVALPGAGEPCSWLLRCARGLGCSSASWTCVALPGRAEPCLFDEARGLWCRDELVCLGDACADPMGAGGPCTFTDECAGGLACDGDPPTCGPPAAVGDPCGGGCAEGAYCGPGDVCATDVGVGDRCGLLYGECSAGACALDASGERTCMAAPGAGDPCSFPGAPCPAGLVCRKLHPVMRPGICRWW